MKLVAILGAEGQLGSALVPELRARSAVLSYSHKQVDITNRKQVRNMLQELSELGTHKFIINCAAMTDVDRCELEPDLAWKVNFEGPKTLVEEIQRSKYRFYLIHFSTDFVFDGTSPPYHEQSTPNPINEYGKSKLAGEKVVLENGGTVIRVSWLFGKPGRDFISKILDRYRKGERRFEVVYDLVGTPTWSGRVAGILIVLMHQICANHIPVVHMTNSGSTSKYHLVKFAFDVLGIKDVEVVPVPSSKFPTPAPRPKNTTMTSVVLPKYKIHPRHFWSDLALYVRRLYNEFGRGE